MNHKLNIDTMKPKAALTWCMPFVAFILMLTSCEVKSNYFQKQVPVPNAKWSATFMPLFTLDITDTSAKYNCYLIIRHDESYPNSNLWFRLKMREPGTKKWIDGPRMEVPLSDPEGKWLGRGMGGIWEQKVRLNPASIPQFNHSGTYELKMEQLMRYDPLPAVLNVGLVVEKTMK